jgi:hypothetical protein
MTQRRPLGNNLSPVDGARRRMDKDAGRRRRRRRRQSDARTQSTQSTQSEDGERRS